MRKRLGVTVLLSALAAGLVLRRLGRRWGATTAEVREPLPGDELVPHATQETTHSITIRASAARVWPWLVQMGYGRGGWYTDAWWYRMIDWYVWHVRIPVADRIIPELQHVAVGDIVPDGPPGTAEFTVAEVEPERVLALYSTTHLRQLAPLFMRENPRIGLFGAFSWIFVLRPLDDGATRLIVRTRANYGPRLFRLLTLPVLLPADFLLARMMLRGIRQRAERLGAVAAQGIVTREVEPAGTPA